MARPRKDESQKVKRREIYATDSAWEDAKGEAKAAGVSVSRLLLERPDSSGPSREVLMTRLEALHEIRELLTVIAQSVVGCEAQYWPSILLELIAVERRMRALIELEVRS